MHYKQNHIYIGLDLHKDSHTGVIINCWNEKLDEITFENRPHEFPIFLNKVRKYSPDGLIPIFGLEDTGGYGRSLAVFLIENKQIVKEVNSALSYAERKSYPNIQKSDGWDALCIANVLLRMLETLPTANPQDSFWTLGQLVSRRNVMVKGLTVMNNQLHTQLSHSYPSYKEFFSDLDSNVSLAFWEKYPSPHHLQSVEVEELAVHLRKHSHNVCSTRKAKAILELVVRDGDTQRELQEARDFLVQSVIADIRFKKQEIEKIEEMTLAQSDVLSKIYTGIGYTERALYTNKDTSTIYVENCCIGFNGLDNAAWKEDLMTRIIEFPTKGKIKEGRLSDSKRRKMLTEDLPYIRGAMYEIVSKAMGIIDNINSKLTSVRYGRSSLAFAMVPVTPRIMSKNSI